MFFGFLAIKERSLARPTRTPFELSASVQRSTICSATRRPHGDCRTVSSSVAGLTCPTARMGSCSCVAWIFRLSGKVIAVPIVLGTLSALGRTGDLQICASPRGRHCQRHPPNSCCHRTGRDDWAVTSKLREAPKAFVAFWGLSWRVGIYLDACAGQLIQMLAPNSIPHHQGLVRSGPQAAVEATLKAKSLRPMAAKANARCRKDFRTKRTPGKVARAFGWPLVIPYFAYEWITTFGDDVDRTVGAIEQESNISDVRAGGSEGVCACLCCLRCCLG